MSGLKPAEEGSGLVFRVYEPAGRRGDFAVSADGWSASAVTIMEEPQTRDATSTLMPFEVRSWKLTK
jgi:alpha-mannosidase